MAFRSRALLAWVLTCLTFAACKKEDPKKAPSDVVTLGIVTGLLGVTEPCGCTSKPLGGLDRLAALVEKKERDNPAFGLLVVGDTFVTDVDPPAHLFEQEQKKAGVIAEVLGKLAPIAVLRGPSDLGMFKTPIEAAAASVKLPLLSQPRGEQTRSRIDSKVVTLGGMKIGILGSPEAALGDTGKELNAYTAGALVLRAQGAEFVVALIPEAAVSAQELIPHLDRIDVVVTGGNDGVFDARVTDQTLVVEAGDRGRFLGLLKLHRKGEGAWVFDEQGRIKKRELTTRIDRLKEEIAELDEGPAKAARSEKLAALERELSSFVPPKPTSRYVTFEVEEITKALPQAPWAKEKLAGYNRSLCDLAKTSTADRDCAVAETPAQVFVGNDACKTCHAAAFEVWQKTKHAQAWNTLTTEGKECDLGCIGCHTIGFEKPGGFCRLVDAAKYRDVGCENCHGAGSGHVQNLGNRELWGAQFTRARSPDVCVQCHNQEHSDQFNFETYLPRILGPGHGG